MFFVLMFSSVAFGGTTKVEVCHIPPGDPDNYHTIKISEKAVAGHLKHHDLLGACEDDGECNPETGDCPEVPCPCFDEDQLIAFGTGICELDDPNLNVYKGFNLDGGEVCSGIGCTDKGAADGLPGCSYQATGSSEFIDHAISTEVNDTCRTLIETHCP